MNTNLPLNQSAVNYHLRILGNPASGDEYGFRTAMQHNAQGLSDRLFSALAKVLGGQAPSLNFVADIPPAPGLEVEHLSATPAQNRINLDPYATEGLVDETSATHSGAVNQIPHEMAHLRQTAAVLASLADREGGAQAFADLVSPVAAELAKTNYDSRRNFDGAYASYVTQALAKGSPWLLGGQFGRTPVAWP